MQSSTQNAAPNNAVAAEPAKEETAIAPVSLEEVEELTKELKRLLVHYESTLESEGIKNQIETLERWMESYRRGLSAAQKLSDKAPEWLNEVHDKLKLASEELMRLESEGGNPATKEQAKQAEELMKAAEQVNKLAPTIEQMLQGEATSCGMVEPGVKKAS